MEASKAPKPTGKRWAFRLAEMMGLVVAAACATNWPGAAFLIVPLVAVSLACRIGMLPKRRVWIPAFAAYFFLFPFTLGPAMRANIWLAENVLDTPGYAPVMELYRPLIRHLKDSPARGIIWRWTGWWLGGAWDWDP